MAADTNKTHQALEARLEALETQASFQDELLNTLNDQVSHQQLTMSRLWDANRLLQEQLRSLQRGGAGEEGENETPEPPPPHY